jgi:hypothetical protein
MSFIVELRDYDRTIQTLREHNVLFTAFGNLVEGDKVCEVLCDAGYDNGQEYEEWHAIHVNVYLVDMAYGGPEEGGWYFDYGEVLESHQVNSLSEAVTLKEKLEGKYSNEGRHEISSVLSRGVYRVWIETRAGKNFPAERPRYE